MGFKEHTKRFVVAALTGLYHILVTPVVIHVAVTYIQDHTDFTR
jgi:hypothetical protein